MGAILGATLAAGLLSVAAPGESLQGGSTLLLENPRIRVVLDADEPRVLSYEDLETGAVLLGDPFENSAGVVLLEGVVATGAGVAVSDVSATPEEIAYDVVSSNGAGASASFRLVFSLEERGLAVGIVDVEEVGGWLVECSLPALITILGSDPDPRIAFPFFDGRLIDVATTTPGFEFIGVRGMVPNPLQAVFPFKQDIGGRLSWSHLDLAATVNVYDDGGLGRLAQIGALFRYRYLPSDFTDAAVVPAFDPDTMRAEIAIFTDEDSDTDVDWIDGAKQFRDTVEVTPHDFLADAWITLYGADFLPQILDILEGDGWCCTLEDMANLTDNARIVTSLISASDNPPGARGIYVAIFGTPEDFQEDFATAADVAEAISQARTQYNTTLNFADNYHDYLLLEPGYDEDLACTDENGDPSPSFGFEGFESTVVDTYDYMLGEGLDRIQRTLDRYPLADFVYQDVLSFVPSVPDFSPASPSSIEKLRRGLQILIDRYAQSGIAIGSEGLTEHSARMGFGWYLSIPVPDQPDSDLGFPFDSDEIPLLEFSLHGKTLYAATMCCGGSNTVADNLVLGAGSGSVLDPEDVSGYYLIELPWQLLNRRPWQDFEEAGSYRKVTYDTDTYVEADSGPDTYKVVVDGKTIGENYTTVYKKDFDTYLAFSRDPGTLEIALPSSWLEAGVTIEIHELTRDGLGASLPFSITEGLLSFTASPGVPNKVVATGVSNPAIFSDGFESGDTSAWGR